MQPTAEQFTEKAWAAIIEAQNLAQSSRHQHLESEHVLLALLKQNGLAGRILSRSGVDTNRFEATVESHLKRLPSLGSPPESVFLGRSVNAALDRAERLRDQFSDSYIAIEHLLLALAEDDRCGRQLLPQGLAIGYGVPGGCHLGHQKWDIRPGNGSRRHRGTRCCKPVQALLKRLFRVRVGHLRRQGGGKGLPEQLRSQVGHKPGVARMHTNRCRQGMWRIRRHRSWV